VPTHYYCDHLFNGNSIKYWTCGNQAICPGCKRDGVYHDTIVDSEQVELISTL